MRNLLLTIAVLPMIMDTDALSRQILTKTTQENGGVTAAVRVGSGQVVALRITDPSIALAPLKPAAGLVPKPAKAKRRAARRAAEQLKRVADGDNL